MNTELLLKVKAHILEEPKRICMNTWIVNTAQCLRVKGLMTPKCGTVGCIYGWGRILAKGAKAWNNRWTPPEVFSFEDKATLFGLDTAEGRRLFLDAFWPVQFEERLAVAKPQSSAYARVVADRIDHFIATNGAE